MSPRSRARAQRQNEAGQMVLADKVLNARQQRQRLIDRPGPEGLAHQQTDPIRANAATTIRYYPDRLLAPPIFRSIRTAADHQEHKQNERHFGTFHQMFPNILYSPARAEARVCFSRSARPRPPVVALITALAAELGRWAPRHGRACPGHPRIQRTERPKASNKAKACDCAAASIRD